MIQFVTDDIFTSPAEAIVNTVNCEGYMGKGLAYQFKLKYPKNNLAYIKACKHNNIAIGKLHYYQESGKLIINFPTKNKWREKSQLEYISKGLEDLKHIIVKKKIKSIAIPPLGSGNGGLDWSNVKTIIIEKLSSLDNIMVYIHEPGTCTSMMPKIKPKLSLSALILVYIKLNLRSQISKSLVLQKTAFFMDAKLEKPYFRFRAHKYGPYDDSIRIISRDISEYKRYFNIKTTTKLFESIQSEIVSERIDKAYKVLKPALEKSIAFMNTLNDIHKIECVSTILYIVQQNRVITETEIINGFEQWSVEKRMKFSDNDILEGIHLLIEAGYLEKTLLGYSCSAVF